MDGAAATGKSSILFGHAQSGISWRERCRVGRWGPYFGMFVKRIFATGPVQVAVNALEFVPPSSTHRTSREDSDSASDNEGAMNDGECLLSQ